MQRPARAMFCINNCCAKSQRASALQVVSGLGIEKPVFQIETSLDYQILPTVVMFMSSIYTDSNGYFDALWSH